MSQTADSAESDPVPDTPWDGRLEFAEGGGGYAREPDSILCLNLRARRAVERLVELRGGDQPEVVPHAADGDVDESGAGAGAAQVAPDDEGSATDGADPAVSDADIAPVVEYVVRSPLLDVDADVAELSDRGFDVEPSYVVFANGWSGPACGCGCGWGSGPAANPLYASPLYASPLYASAAGYADPQASNASGQFAGTTYASPLYASPVYASPLYASPLYASEYKRTGRRSSSARPSHRPVVPGWRLDRPDDRLIILDTGIAPPNTGVDDPGQLPPFLEGTEIVGLDNAANWDFPDGQPGFHDEGVLLPAAGHGTFIAGIVQSLAPGRTIEVHRVLGGYGDGRVAEIARRLRSIAQRLSRDDEGHRTIVNCSFGGYADPDMRSLGRAIRLVQATGAVVVASAGNDATCRPAFPAAFSGVVSVGALDASGPAPFSNHGPWVRACAPGTDLVSAFFRDFNGHLPLPPDPGGVDPDDFERWARWSGTSFAGPVVAAALLRHMALTGATAKEAVGWIVDRPGLLHVPMLGTVVNMMPPLPS